jgi:hypothetical protein
MSRKRTLLCNFFAKNFVCNSSFISCVFHPFWFYRSNIFYKLQVMKIVIM